MLAIQLLLATALASPYAGHSSSTHVQMKKNSKSYGHQKYAAKKYVAKKNYGSKKSYGCGGKYGSKKSKNYGDCGVDIYVTNPVKAVGAAPAIAKPVPSYSTEKAVQAAPANEAVKAAPANEAVKAAPANEAVEAAPANDEVKAAEPVKEEPVAEAASEKPVGDAYESVPASDNAALPATDEEDPAVFSSATGLGSGILGLITILLV